MRTIEELHKLLDRKRGPTRIRHFEHAADHVIQGWQERQDLEGRPPCDTDVGFLKRGAYQVIYHYLDSNQGIVIRELVRSDGRVPRRGPTFEENPFHWGLLAMFNDPSILDKDQRRLFANQMLYAYWHGVHEHFLIGFIYQLGRTDRIYTKVKENQREPWFGAARD